MDRPDIETLQSDIVYQNRWITVREDKIRRRDGSEGIYGFVEKVDFVVIAAIDDGQIHLVEQYRYPVKQRFWEMPQGAWDQAPDSSAEDVARRECGKKQGWKQVPLPMPVTWQWPMASAPMAFTYSSQQT